MDIYAQFGPESQRRAVTQMMDMYDRRVSAEGFRAARVN